MAKYSAIREWEIFTAINDNAADRDALMVEWGNTKPMAHLLSMNFSPRVIIDLPSGMPPYNRDEVTNNDFQGALVHSIDRIKYCFKGSNLPKIKKEQIFIEILNSVNPKSADILVFCKDKALHELFPNITKELVEKHYPQLVA